MTSQAFDWQGTPRQVQHPMTGICQDKSEDRPSPQPNGSRGLLRFATVCSREYVVSNTCVFSTQILVYTTHTLIISLHQRTQSIQAASSRVPKAPFHVRAISNSSPSIARDRFLSRAILIHGGFLPAMGVPKNHPKFDNFSIDPNGFVVPPFSETSIDKLAFHNHLQSFRVGSKTSGFVKTLGSRFAMASVYWFKVISFFVYSLPLILTTPEPRRECLSRDI